MLEVTVIIVGVIFLVVAILSLGKMYDAQKELEFVKNIYEEELKDILDICQDNLMSDSAKVNEIREKVR